jgi:multidrug transporter EmrE-like cation transporter
MIISNLLAPKLVQGAIIIVAVIAVAVADVMLKRAAAHGSLKAALSSPWLILAVCLYLLQIGLFIIVFMRGWKLSIIGALQTSFYALIVLAAGVLLYNETLTRLQVIGILLALTGVVLINWR